MSLSCSFPNLSLNCITYFNPPDRKSCNADSHLTRSHFFHFGLHVRKLPVDLQHSMAPDVISIFGKQYRNLAPDRLSTTSIRIFLAKKEIQYLRSGSRTEEQKQQEVSKSPYPSYPRTCTVSIPVVEIT